MIEIYAIITLYLKGRKMVNGINKLFVAADKACDYIPVVSTVSNLVDLFQKQVVLPRINDQVITKSRYYTHLKNKPILRSIILLIPVIGNVCVGIYDFARSIARSNKGFMLAAVQQDGGALGDASKFGNNINDPVQNPVNLETDKTEEKEANFLRREAANIKEHSKESLDLLASKMEVIRKKRAEQNQLKQDLEATKKSQNPSIKKVVEDSEENVAKGRYKQAVNDDRNGIGTYLVGEYKMKDGKKVYPAPKSDISLDKIELIAKKLIKHNDRNGLRKLCNTLFIGLHGSSSMSNHTQYRESRALRMLLNDPESDLEGAEKLLIEGIKKFRKHFSPAVAQKPSHAKAWMRNAGTPEWAKDPEAWIEISHGGGEENIHDFLNGRSDGYKLENFGTGLQVSPNYNERDNDYAQRAYAHFDRPAILKARIQAKHLQLAQNAYEAGLTPENVKYLQNVKVELAPFTAGKVMIDRPDIEDIKNNYGNDIAKNLEDSRLRMQKRNNKTYTSEELKKIGY